MLGEQRQGHFIKNRRAEIEEDIFEGKLKEDRIILKI